MQILTTISNFPAHSRSFTIDEGEFIFEFTYRKRTSSWYIDVLSAEGEPLASGRRLTPGWNPLDYYARPPLPLGVFLVTGPDNYAKNDLGERLLILYVPEAEIPEPPSLIPAPRVIDAT
jgi:hypothetical protein